MAYQSNLCESEHLTHMTRSERQSCFRKGWNICTVFVIKSWVTTFQKNRADRLKGVAGLGGAVEWRNISTALNLAHSFIYLCFYFLTCPVWFPNKLPSGGVDGMSSSESSDFSLILSQIWNIFLHTFHMTAGHNHTINSDRWSKSRFILW